MTEQDYYAQFVGDDNYDLDRWPIATQDMLDRLNELTYERVKVQSVLFGVSVTRHPDAAEQCHIYGRHTWQMLLGGRRCITCGKQEAVPICEDGTHIWGAPVLGPTICVICGTAKPVVPPRCAPGLHRWISDKGGVSYCSVCGATQA